MIKVKRKEFIKFLSILNEMRSSHSASMIDNAGDQDNTPVDATSKMSALQLTTSLPDLTDPEWSPSSNQELRDALIAISKEVPKEKLEDFYKRSMKLFEKTIDQMSEEDNPFNPKNLAEAITYLFENKDDETSEEDSEEELNKQVEKEVEEDDPSLDDYYDEKLRQVAYSLTGDKRLKRQFDDEEDIGPEELPSLKSLVDSAGGPATLQGTDSADSVDDLLASMGFDVSDEEDSEDFLSSFDSLFGFSGGEGSSSEPSGVEYTSIDQLKRMADVVYLTDNGKDDKYVFVASNPNKPKNITPDTKEGERVKGKLYKDRIKIIGDFYRHNTIMDAGGDYADIIIVDSIEDANDQYDAYLDGGAKQFVDIAFNSGANTEETDNRTLDEIIDDVDFGDMDFDDIFDSILDDDAAVKQPEEIAAVISKEVADLTDGDWQPEEEILGSLEELLGSLRSYMIYKKIELYNNIFKPERFKDMARRQGVGSILGSRLTTGMSNADAAAMMKGGESTSLARSKVVSAISSEYLKNPDEVADMLGYHLLPSYLIKLAALLGFPKEIEIFSAKNLFVEGVKDLIRTIGDSDTLEKLVKRIKSEAREEAKSRFSEDELATEKGKERLARLITSISESKFDEEIEKLKAAEYTNNDTRRETVEKANELFMSPERYIQTKSYVTMLSTGKIDQVYKSALSFYLTLAKLGYYMYKNRLDFSEEEPEFSSTVVKREKDGKKRVRLSSNKTKDGPGKEGTIFKIYLTGGHPINKAIESAAMKYVKGMPVSPTDVEFNLNAELMFQDEMGDISEQKSLETAKRISKKPFISMDIYESWVWSSCYFYTYEAARGIVLPRETIFVNRADRFTLDDSAERAYTLARVIKPNLKSSRPVMDPKEHAKDWPLLSKQESDTCNSMLEGVDLQFYNTIYKFVEEVLKSPSPTIYVLEKSSEETGGNIDSTIPSITYCYLAPFIIAKWWQKEISEHQARSYREKRVFKPEETAKSAIFDMEKFLDKEAGYLKSIAPFTGFSGASGVAKFAREHIGQKDYSIYHFLTGEGEYPGGRAYFNTISRTISDASFAVSSFVERYLASAKSARDNLSEKNPNSEELDYWNDLVSQLEEVSKNANKLNEIHEEFDTFDIEEMRSDGGELISTVEVEIEEDGEKKTVQKKKFDDLNDELSHLLTKTIAGQLVREIAHMSSVPFPKRSSSFLPDVVDFITNISISLIFHHPDFDPPGPFGKNPALKKIAARQFVDVMLSFKNCQLDNIRHAYQEAQGFSPHQAAQTFISHGFTARTYQTVKYTTSEIYDLILAIVLSPPRDYKKLEIDIDNILKYKYQGPSLTAVKKDIKEEIAKIKPSSIYEMSNQRIESISSAATNKTAFLDMSDFFDSLMYIGELNIALNEYRRTYEDLLNAEIKKYCKENETDIDDIPVEVIKKLEKPIKKKRKEIADEAFKVSKEIEKIKKNMPNPLALIKARIK